MKNEIILIAAIGKNRGLGFGNNLLWNLKKDMKFFRKHTMHNVVIMGYKTFQSIGKPLPNRINIILKRNKIDIEGVEVVNSVNEALNLAKEYNKKIFIIGGGQIYNLFLPLADKLYLTLINDGKKADIFFPEFREKFEQYWKRDKEENDIHFSLTKWKKI